MRRTARVNSKPSAAPGAPAPPTAPDAEFWHGDARAEPDSQWLRTLDARADATDPPFDRQAPRGPIGDLLPETAAVAPAAPPAPEPPAAERWVVVDPLPPPSSPAPERWVADDVGPVPPPDPFDGAWTAGDDVVTPPPDAPEEWVTPGAFVAPAPARAAAPLDLPEPSVPDVVDAPRAASTFGEPAAVDVPAEPPRRARRSLFEYAEPEPEPEPEPAPEPVPAVEWTAASVTEPEPVPAVEWTAASVAEPPAVIAHEAVPAPPVAPQPAPMTSATDWLQPANDDLLPQY
jgi:hypothetical protein